MHVHIMFTYPRHQNHTPPDEKKFRLTGDSVASQVSVAAARKQAEAFKGRGPVCHRTPHPCAGEKASKAATERLRGSTESVKLDVETPILYVQSGRLDRQAGTWRSCVDVVRVQ